MTANHKLAVTTFFLHSIETSKLTFLGAGVHWYASYASCIQSVVHPAIPGSLLLFMHATFNVRFRRARPCTRLRAPRAPCRTAPSPVPWRACWPEMAPNLEFFLAPKNLLWREISRPMLPTAPRKRGIATMGGPGRPGRATTRTRTRTRTRRTRCRRGPALGQERTQGAGYVVRGAPPLSL